VAFFTVSWKLVLDLIFIFVYFLNTNTDSVNRVHDEILLKCSVPKDRKASGCPYA